MGYLRFSLIIAVVYYHLADKTIAGPIAVHGFFVLSGYLITLVANEIYNKGWHGRWCFLANRAARVYPTYLVCLGISLFCMWLTGFTTHFYHQEFLLPSTAVSWLWQFTIVGQTWLSGERWPERILLPAWSLSTEVVYYFIIGLITGKSRMLTTAAFALSALASTYWFINDYSYQHFYFSIQGPALVFFTGAMFYHWRHLFRGLYIKNPWVLLILANAILYAPDLLDMQRHNILILYVGMFYLAYLIMCLHVRSLEQKKSRFDQFLADITYPMFLLHWPVGAIVCIYWVGEYQRNFDIFLLSLPFILIVSAALVFAVEMPVKAIRRHFRQHALGSPGVP